MFHFCYSHGNHCASVIAAVANNSLCGVGLAFNAQIAGKSACMWILLEDAWCFRTHQLTVFLQKAYQKTEQRPVGVRLII